MSQRTNRNLLCLSCEYGNFLFFTFYFFNSMYFLVQQCIKKTNRNTHTHAHAHYCHIHTSLVLSSIHPFPSLPFLLVFFINNNSNKLELSSLISLSRFSYIVWCKPASSLYDIHSKFIFCLPLRPISI